MASTPAHERRLEFLRSLSDWMVYPKGDMFVVSRMGGEAMRGRFRTRSGAERAAAKANIETWLRLALNVAPEPINLPGHIDYCSQLLARDVGASLAAARTQCEKWADDELSYRLARDGFSQAERSDHREAA